MLETAIGPVGQQLEKLRLVEAPIGKGSSDLVPCAVQHVQAAFGELLATSPSTLIAPTGQNDRELEARMWDAFAEVYEKELATLRASSGNSSSEVSKERKRQVLADILVWAEITQSHYDQNTASFVTDPHGGDASFQRIGRLLKAAKKGRGL